MKFRFYTAPAMVCLLLALALGWLTLGPFMRETDQGWLLDGGMAIAKGHPQIARTEFNFDKQFVSYFLPSLVDRCLPRPFVADTLVYAANVFGFAFFWGALWWLFARSAKRLSLVVALPVMLTPAFLIFSPFYASAFTSAAFIFLLADFLGRARWNVPLRAVTFLLAFLAVGARADALFVLPLLAMLHSPRRNFGSVLFSPNTWLMAAGGLTAFFVGRALFLTFSIEFAHVPFHLKQYFGYVAFGLGATTLLLLAGLHALVRARKPEHRRVWIFFLWLGLALPMAFYSFQLLSPRHCTLGAVAVAVFVCAKRGRAIFQSYFRAPLAGGLLKIIILAAALVPLLLGVNLADLHHPKMTFLKPTLLPSAAGAAPAGGYLGFLVSIKPLKGYLDHNQAVWNVARDTQYKADAGGTVPFPWTPMESYLKFAIRLQNELPRRYNLEDGLHLPPDFYCESRTLMRMQFTWPVEVGNYFFATYRLAPVVTANWHGITLLRCQTNAPESGEFSSAALWALNQSFGPDEFRLEEVSLLKKIPADWAGKKITLASRGEFRVKTSLSKTGRTIAGEPFGAWHRVEFPAARAGELVELPVTGEKIYVGVGALPAWMTLKKD